MPKKNETKSNEATKVEIDVHVYIHSDLDDIDLGDRVRKPGVKCGGFADAMLRAVDKPKG
jgi:hypothetical protein